MAIPAVALLQQHDAQRGILIEPAARRRGGVQRSKLGGIPNWGVRNWGRSELGAVKTNRLVNYLLTLKSGSCCFSFKSSWLFTRTAVLAKIALRIFRCTQVF